MSDGLPGFVCEGIMSVPVGTGVEGEARSLVDKKSSSGLDRLRNSKAMHDPTLGPWGVEMY